MFLKVVLLESSTKKGISPQGDGLGNAAHGRESRISVTVVISVILTPDDAIKPVLR
jgi:hypothetical protein